MPGHLLRGGAIRAKLERPDVSQLCRVLREEQAEGTASAKTPSSFLVNVCATDSSNSRVQVPFPVISWSFIISLLHIK